MLPHTLTGVVAGDDADDLATDDPATGDDAHG